MKARPGFMLYFEMADALSSMADADAGQLFKALMAYARYGEVREVTGLAAFAFEMMRGRMDRDAEAYAEKCRKSAYAAYSGAARRRGEIPVDYEDWNGADACGRMQTITTTTNPTTTPNTITNTTVISNTDAKPSGVGFSTGFSTNGPPAQAADTAWVLEYLDERKRKRQGGAECRSNTGS